MRCFCLTAFVHIYCFCINENLFDFFTVLSNFDTACVKVENRLLEEKVIEDSEEIDGVLIILNTVGGDVEAGLAISEMIASAKYSSKDDIDNRDKTLKDKIDALVK